MPATTPAAAVVDDPDTALPSVDPRVVLIGLPWGLATNWARNVVTAGEARLTWKGRGHRVTDPHVVEPIEAMALARRPFRLVLRVKFTIG